MEWRCRIITPPTAARIRHRRSPTGTSTSLASAVFDLLGTSGSGVRIHGRPSKLRAQQRMPSQSGKRTLPSAELRRAPRPPEGWPPDALPGKLIADKSPHGQRRRSLCAWETVHKTAEIQPTASGANLSCHSFGPGLNLVVARQGNVYRAQDIYAFQTLPDRSCVPNIAFRVSTMQWAQSARSW